MISHLTTKLALRARLLSFVAATTGSTSLSATATGYARAAGSFSADGFAAGMELRGAGFVNAVNNGVGVITKVTPLALTVTMIVVTIANNVRTVTRPVNIAEAPSAGRSLIVGPPSFVAWENLGFTPEAGVPYMDEQYARGPTSLGTIGPLGRIIAEPMYLPRINVPANSGVSAADRYADAMVNAFPPGDVIGLAGGNSIHVRADEAPSGGQLLPGEPGFSGLLCTIPLRCYAINSI